MSPSNGCRRRIPCASMLCISVMMWSSALTTQSLGQAKDVIKTEDIAKDQTVKGGKDGNLRFHVLEVTPGKGEICLVCDHPIGGEETCVLIQFRGRKMTVNKVNMALWRADPNRYFQKLSTRASGALFDESAVLPDQMGGTPDWAWLIFAVYILAGLMMGGACSYVAVTRGHPPMPWFMLGLFINGFAMLMLLSKGQGDAPAPAGMPGGFRKVPSTHTPVPCPKCGSTNHPSANHCSGCGAEMSPTFSSEASKIET